MDDEFEFEGAKQEPERKAGLADVSGALGRFGFLPERKRSPWVDAFRYVAVLCLAASVWCAGVLAIMIGVALGNGVPMARSVSAATKAGFEMGLKECPCRKQSANVVSRSQLKPIPEKPNADTNNRETVPDLTKALGRDTVDVGPAIGLTPTPLEPLQ